MEIFNIFRIFVPNILSATQSKLVDLVILFKLMQKKMGVRWYRYGNKAYTLLPIIQHYIVGLATTPSATMDTQT